MSRSRRPKNATLLATVALSASSAIAANPPAKAPQVPSGRPQTESQQPVKIEYDAGINTAAVAVQRSGGSLAKAQLRSMPPLPVDAKQGREVSFYAVPEPEPRTIRKHDLVTVIIREESTSSAKGTTDAKRESTLEAQLDEFVKLKLGNMEIEGGAIGPTPPSIKASGNRDFKGEGTVNRTDTLVARMTAEVVDVKPNGTLVLQARKTIKSDDEEQQFILTGTCRVEDIIADNSVLSTQMYDLRVEKNTKGAVRGATKRSWLGEFLDAISPF